MAWEEMIQIVCGDMSWSGDGKGACISFLRFVQEFSEKIAMTLKRTVLVAHPVLVVLLNSSAASGWLRTAELDGIFAREHVYV